MARDREHRTPFVIGVAGGTACGKSLVTNKIMERLAGTEMKTKQSFYRELEDSERAQVVDGDYDFDHPGAFSFDTLHSAMLALLRGDSVKVPHYDFLTNSNTGMLSITPADVIIVEGILVFYDERIRSLMDMKLFVDADADIRLARRVHRDTVERKRDLEHVLKQYMTKVKPSFEDFCQPTKKYADVIIPRHALSIYHFHLWDNPGRGGENDVAIDLLVQHIQDLVRTPRGSPDSLSTNGHGELKRTNSASRGRPH